MKIAACTLVFLPAAAWAFQGGSSFHGFSSNRPRLALVSDDDLSSWPLSENSAFSAHGAILNEYNDFLPQPGPDWEAVNVVHACMQTLLEHRDAGLEVCFNFSSDRCRAALGGSLDKFNEFATNPIFSYLVKCANYDIVNVGPIIAASNTRGEMQTVLMDANQPGGSEARNSKRFLWTLQKERRPPRQGFWVIHEVIYTNNAHRLTM
eukprot:CAMPEP_0198143440 /NCGR_PEP_ID=MMETSP1443-20131203/7539_1 /TAXON_ID=186043 /ORGANISM="Entomoneis sp., Strain CCMP2396" /LENGTH=206 /DNA_ID=CAMNT_0043806677 /DNA_START=93 /DNA_END=713 /DNA_ORIENTATION=-